MFGSDTCLYRFFYTGVFAIRLRARAGCLQTILMNVYNCGYDWCVTQVLIDQKELLLPQMVL